MSQPAQHGAARRQATHATHNTQHHRRVKECVRCSQYPHTHAPARADCGARHAATTATAMAYGIMGRELAHEPRDRGGRPWTVRHATLCQSLCCSGVYCMYAGCRVPGVVAACRVVVRRTARRGGGPDGQTRNEASQRRQREYTIDQTAKFQHMNMQHQPSFTSQDPIPIARLAATPIPTRELAESTQPPPPLTALTQAHPAQCSPACRQEQSPREPPHLPLDCCPASTADDSRQPPSAPQAAARLARQGHTLHYAKRVADTSKAKVFSPRGPGTLIAELESLENRDACPVV